MKLICTECSTEFEREVPENYERFPTFKICNECVQKRSAKIRADDERKKDAELKARWFTFCPPVFHDTDINRLPFPKISQKAVAWECGSRGVILYGKTRSGKTRTAWLMVRKQFKAGHQVCVMDSMSGFEYAGVFTDGGQAAMEWVKERANCPLLFLDDVFKVKLTESFEAAMFAIIDHRFNYKLPIIVTLNDTGATLSARMSGDRGDAFIARLKEMCDTIHFQ